MNPDLFASRAERRHDIDWLRVVATWLLLVFHTAMVFNPAPFFHVRNAETSFFFLVFCGFIGLWHMPLFFLLAGWSACASIRERGVRAFLHERVFRLFVPLLAGCTVMMPVIKFFELSNGLDANYTGLSVDPTRQDGFRQVIPAGLPVAPHFDERFLDFLPTFFTNPSRFTWAHLWFVAYLLLFSVLLLPLFLRILRSRDGVFATASRWWVFAPIVPLTIIQWTMRARWPGLPNLVQDWANVAYYGTYLIAGACLARSPSLDAAAGREWKRALAIGVATSGVLLLGALRAFDSPTVLLAGSAVAGWCFVLALVGWAGRLRSVAPPVLARLTESAFPVYLLHQAAIVVPGYFLIRSSLGVWPKFFLLLAVSSVLTFGVYHGLVRPFSVPRFLCGMKPKREARVRFPAARRAAVGVLLGVALVGNRPAAGDAVRSRGSDLAGLWHAEGGAARIALHDCGESLCGRIVWLRSPFDEHGCALRDRLNPDESLRERSMIGLEILSELSPAPDREGVWQNGRIYDPTSGSTYRATLTRLDDDRISVRGWVGIPVLGRSTTWLRVGSESATCAADRSIKEDPR